MSATFPPDPPIPAAECRRGRVRRIVGRPLDRRSLRPVAKRSAARRPCSSETGRGRATRRRSSGPSPRTHEAVCARDTIDQDVEIDRTFDLDHVVHHAAERSAVAHFVEAISIGRRHVRRVGLDVCGGRRLLRPSFSRRRASRVDLGSLDCRYVVVRRFGRGFYSMNDSSTTHSITRAHAISGATTVVNAFQAIGVPNSHIFLMTMNPVIASGSADAATRTSVPDYYQDYRDLATTLGIGLIDNYPAWTASGLVNTTNIPDGIHPTLEAFEAVTVPTMAGVLAPLMTG